MKEIRFGRIKAVIWRNPGTGGNGPMFNTTLARLYKGPEEAAWKETQSFGREDLLAAKALGEAHTWIYREAARSRNPALSSRLFERTDSCPGSTCISTDTICRVAKKRRAAFCLLSRGGMSHVPRCQELTPCTCTLPPHLARCGEELPLPKEVVDSDGD